MHGLAASQRRLIFFIILTMILTPFAIDEYAASLPHMARALHADGAMMQLSITVFILVLAFSQLVVGTISNYQGRRWVLLICIMIYLAGTLLCIYTDSYQILLVGRLFQGIGCGMPNIYPPIVIGEAISPDEVPKVTSYYILGYSIIPVIAPFIGGYFQEYFHWQANFWFLFAVGLVVLVPCLFWLPETLDKSALERFSISSMLRQYKEVLSNIEFLASCFSSFFIWSPVIVFSVIAPFILQDTLHVSPSTYGDLALTVGAGFFIGNSMNTFLVKKSWVSQKAIILIGFSVWALAGVAQVVLMFMGQLSVVIVIAPVFIMMMGMSFSFPAVYAISLSATRLPGVAGSLINTIILLCVAALTAIIAAYHVRTGTIFSIILFGCACAAAICYKLSVQFQRRVCPPV